MTEVPDREETMKRWDSLRAYFSEGRGVDPGGSHPRDMFESIIDDYDECIAALKAGWSKAFDLGHYHQTEHYRLRDEVAALQRFKDFVHRRLDDAGVPTHPDGPHSKEGCRIGDRLDIVLSGRDIQKETPNG